MDNERKKVALSGVQPTSYPQIGNYIGSIRNWKQFQENYTSLFFIADLHSLTARQDPKLLKKRSVDLLALYMACGLDPEKCILYIQSHVPAHAELMWLLNCFTYMGELSRMTQFKDKSKKNESNINAGLFTYPVLQAADILLYQTDVVPIGEDQRQHIEIARDIAERFNSVYGNVFVVPEGVVQKVGAKIMSLQEPEKKMSKSDTENPNSTVLMLDEPNVIMNKFKRAVTDSDSEIKYSPQDKPGISNLLTIYSCLTDKTIAEAEKDFEGKGYGLLKTGVAEAVISALTPVQSEFKRLSADKAYMESVMKTNAERASVLAARTLQKVKKKIGLYHV